MERNAMSYEALKDNPSFRAFCRRRLTGPLPKPKKFKVPIPKPKGIWSVLGPYTTGRQVREVVDDTEKYAYRATWDEEYRLVKQGGEFISVPQDERELEHVPYPAWDWPPKNWTPNLPSLPTGEGRWIKALFPGKCAGCGREVRANERGLYYRESRQILCADCGGRAQKERAA